MIAFIPQFFALYRRKCSVGRAIGTKYFGFAPMEVTTRLLKRRSAMTKRQEPHHGFSDDLLALMRF
jgi:hypothetical protein